MRTATRRSFLIASGAMLAGGATQLVGARWRQDPAKTARPRSIRKAVKYGMVGAGETVLDKFRLLREIGFDGVELPAPADLDGDEVLAARDATGLPIHGVVGSAHWQSPLSDPDPAVRRRGRVALETALHDAKRYDASTVLLVPAVVNERVAYDDAYRRSQAEIRAVLPLAAELQIKIALENVWNGFLLSPLEAARYVDELDSPWIGWYFDVGNVVNFGWPEQWVRILGRRILKLDVKEFSRTKRDQEGLWRGFRVPIGEGDCNWPAVMSALDEIGFSGWATAEVAGGDADRLRDIATRMDRVLSA